LIADLGAVYNYTLRNRMFFKICRSTLQPVAFGMKFISNDEK
jgi:hypothetical protein